MNTISWKEFRHNAFFATTITNGLIACADIAAGFCFLYVQLFLYIERIAPFLTPIIEHVRHTASVGAFYFFSHGIIKIFLVWALLSRKLWAYPLAIAFLGGFSIYQAFTLTQEFSWFVAILLVCNGCIAWLIAIEYKAVQTLSKHSR